MKLLTNDQVMEFLGEWMSIAQETGTIKNPFIQFSVLQSKMSALIQRIHDKGYSQGYADKKDDIKITKSN